MFLCIIYCIMIFILITYIYLYFNVSIYLCINISKHIFNDIMIFLKIHYLIYTTFLYYFGNNFYKYISDTPAF